MSLPTITATGNLTADPLIRFTPSGKPVTTLRMACTDRKRNDQTGQWEDAGTCFLDVTIWRHAEQAADTLLKGHSVTVSGRLKQRTYQAKDGTERTTYEIEAETVAKLIDHKTASSQKAAPADLETAWPASNGDSPF